MRAIAAALEPGGDARRGAKVASVHTVRATAAAVGLEEGREGGGGPNVTHDKLSKIQEKRDCGKTWKAKIRLVMYHICVTF